MATPRQFALRSQNLGCRPIVNFFLGWMGLAEHRQTYLPHELRICLTAVAP